LPIEGRKPAVFVKLTIICKGYPENYDDNHCAERRSLFFIFLPKNLINLTDMSTVVQRISDSC